MIDTIHLIWRRQDRFFGLLGQTKFELAEATPILGHLVPKGFQTDGASLPPLLRQYVSPYGDYFPAAVLHDYLLEKGECTREEAAHWFRKALRHQGMPSWVERPFYWAVRFWDHCHALWDWIRRK